MKRTGKPGSLVDVHADFAVSQALSQAAETQGDNSAECLSTAHRTSEPTQDRDCKPNSEESLLLFNARRLSTAVAIGVSSDGVAAASGESLESESNGEACPLPSTAAVPVGSPQRQAAASMRSRLFEKQRKASQVSAVQVQLQLAALSGGAKPAGGHTHMARRR